MMGTTHGLSGIAAGLGVGLLAPSPTVGLLCGVVGGVTAYTPDLDHPNASATKALGPVTWLLCFVLRAVSFQLTGHRHRGITHSLVFALLVGGLAWWAASGWLPLEVAALFGLAALGGVLAALLGDAVTRAGLDHVLWPLSWRLEIPRFLRVKTGGLAERLVVLPVVSLACLVGAGVVIGVWP